MSGIEKPAVVNTAGGTTAGKTDAAVPQREGRGRTLRLVAVHGGDIVMDVDRIQGLAPGRKQVCPIMSFVVDDGENVVLFDTGMNPAVRDDAVGYWGRVAKRVLVPQFPDGVDLLQRLRDAGYPPESITLVVNSHLHHDHAGTNREYPNARVLVRRSEWEHALTLMDTESSGYVRNDFHSGTHSGQSESPSSVPGQYLQPGQSPERGSFREPELFEYDEVYDLLGTSQVSLISTTGHTPGHQSLLVTFPSGRRFVMTGDAVYTAEDLCCMSGPAVAWDRNLAAQSAARLRALEEDGATVLVCHDEPTWADVPTFAVLHEESL